MRKKHSLDLALVDISSLELPASGELLIHDEGAPGLTLRLRASGARTWIVRGPHGSGQRQTLGNALTLPLPHARRLAQTPDGDRTSNGTALPDHITVADILKRYLAYGRKGHWKASTARLMTYLAHRHILPKFERRSVASVNVV